MGRSISFSLDQALDAAMRQFWRGGYAATSLQDLLTAVGVGSGSFYNTFKSKKHLFLESLRRYADTEVRKRTDALVTAPTVSLGLRSMYRLSFDALDDPAAPSRMCMMAAMVSQDVLADPEMRLIVEEGQNSFKVLLESLITRDRERGILSGTIDAKTTASVIATYGQGLLRMALVAYDRSRFERETELFLSGLGL